MGLEKIAVRGIDNLSHEAEKWQRLVQYGESVQVPAYTRRRVVVDLENYYLAFSEMITSGGEESLVRIHWAESLFSDPDHWKFEKGNRGEIEGKYFVGFGDVFLPDGGRQRRFDTLWWQAGRYLEIYVQTAGQPLTIERLLLHETHYPLEMESAFSSSDARFEEVMPILIRAMQMCSNETYFDCPYYEELQYAGDTRLEILTTYIMTRDDRLPKKALRIFDASRLASGLTQSRYPSRVMQIIPPFALWWVMMVSDYAYWRGDPEVTGQLVSGMRQTLAGFQRYIRSDGLLYGPEGWNTLDWVPAWEEDAGVPPDGHEGASGLFNWQLVYALALAADLEDRLGENGLGEHYRQRAARLARCAVGAFWDNKRGLLADDVNHKFFSEHTQCMALLSDGLIPGVLGVDRRERVAQGLLSDPSLDRTTIYFSHYLFETLRMLGRIDVLVERMALWFDLPGQGFKTTFEKPEPSRSDCHAWGAHPLFHYFATILGIRPAALGFREVTIMPQLGPLQQASGKMVHPLGGEISVELRQQNGKLSGWVQLPAGITGRLVCNNQISELNSGENWF